MGDLNAIHFKTKKCGGTNGRNSYFDDLNNMCNKANLNDLNFVGNLFTQFNKREMNRKIYCKLVRALLNEVWLCFF